MNAQSQALETLGQQLADLLDEHPDRLGSPKNDLASRVGLTREWLKYLEREMARLKALPKPAPDQRQKLRHLPVDISHCQEIIAKYDDFRKRRYSYTHHVIRRSVYMKDGDERLKHIVADMLFVTQAGAFSQQLLMALTRLRRPDARLLLQLDPLKHELSDSRVLHRISCISKAPFVIDRLLGLKGCQQLEFMAQAIIARFHSSLCKNIQATFDSFHAVVQAAFPNSIIHDGYQYMTLDNNDPRSRQLDKASHRRDHPLDPAWHICPATPESLHVCAAYPWTTEALVFANGSAVRTGYYMPGTVLCKSRALSSTGGVECEVLQQFVGRFDDNGGHSHPYLVALYADVFIRRKL
jgi:hypothetical protein